jgi:hypothetical protein
MHLLLQSENAGFQTVIDPTPALTSIEFHTLACLPSVETLTAIFYIPE